MAKLTREDFISALKEMRYLLITSSVQFSRSVVSDSL